MYLISDPLFPILVGQPPYLDPGSGSFLLQLLIAGLAGVGLFIGVSWSKLKRLFHRSKNRIESDDEEEEYDD